jgi:hypothetical protein
MYGITPETAHNKAFCVWPNETPYKQQEADEVDMITRLREGENNEIN